MRCCSREREEGSNKENGEGESNEEKTSPFFERLVISRPQPLRHKKNKKKHYHARPGTPSSLKTFAFFCSPPLPPWPGAGS